ncbi:MAG: hypothetical protein D6776_07870 [Planctomycetota bacterium]|nr:MAG: hypothetical protein D6776_07870 [Planctomycetota bacterium]
MVAGWGVAPQGAHAQSSRDAEFARVLLERGFTDLAEKEARRIEASTRYPEKVRGDAGYLLARILKKRARENPAQAPQLLEEMAQLIDELKRKYPTHAMSAIADLEKLQVRVREAESRLAEAENEQDPEKAKADREAAVSIFDEVLGQFEAVIADLNQRVDKAGNKASEDLRYKRDLAEYLYASALFSYGKALGKDDERRKEAFTKARDRYQAFFDERGDFFNLQVLSFLGLGKAQLELGQNEDAALTFTDAIEVEVPFESPDPRLRKEMESFVADAKAEAYYWLLTAHVRAGQYDQAVEVWKDLEQRFPEGKKTHFGKLATLVYAKALAGLGRYDEAARAVAVVLEASMRSKKIIPGYDIDPYGVSAAKTLAEISEGYTGFFPAPLQYRAGQGFIFKRQFEKATWALKGVLAAAATDAERETWGPKALVDLATAYDRLGRPVDAALAYQGLYRMFPGAPNADLAMRLAKQRFLDLEKADGKGFFKRLADEVTDDMQRSLTGIAVEKIKYNRGVESQRLGRYVEAAQEFEKVEPEIEVDGKRQPVDFYGKAIANAGYCWYRAARAERSERRAQRHLEKARAALEKALRYGEEHGDAGAQAAAAYFLALIDSDGNDKTEQDYRRALERLKVFDGPLASDRVYRDKALAQMVHCAVQLAARKKSPEERWKWLGEAERRLAQLAADFPDADDLPFAAFEIGDAYATLSQELAKAGQTDAAGRALRKASGYLERWVKANDKASFGQLAWVGGLLLRAGESAKAAEVLGRAVALVDAGKLGAKQREQLADAYTRVEYAAALVGTGKPDMALEQLDKARERFEAAGSDATSEFLYARTLDEALYRKWKNSGDARLLGRLNEAHDAYWQVLDTLGERGWNDMVATYRLPPVTYYVADKEAAARQLEIRLALKQWRWVYSQIQPMFETGALDDLVARKLGPDVTGTIIEERDDAVVVRTRKGETVSVPRSEIRRIERFPKKLRERFRTLMERAKREGGL